mmetsp:Transcript_35895/g.59494  ORF Transcript_35895/g.59494 Transcript_35895/m.59494 type:complete len:100 (+) Transcript_35895:106-405(+)
MKKRGGHTTEARTVCRSIKFICKQRAALSLQAAVAATNWLGFEPARDVVVLQAALGNCISGAFPPSPPIARACTLALCCSLFHRLRIACSVRDGSLAAT